jgi:hypothetical protein
MPHLPLPSEFPLITKKNKKTLGSQAFQFEYQFKSHSNALNWE